MQVDNNSGKSHSQLQLNFNIFVEVKGKSKCITKHLCGKGCGG